MNLTTKKNWKTVKLGEIADVKGGKRLPLGSVLVSTKTEHPYIRVTDIQDGKVKKDQLQFVPDEVFKNISRYIVDANDIIISIVGSVGFVAFIDEDLHKASLTENCVRITEYKDGVEPKFLFYYLISRLGQHDIQSKTVGSTQPKLPIYNIRNIEIPFPSLAEQREIAGVLGCLDDKIELLRKENKTLEEIAQTLFKEWFVNFNFPGATGKMIDSELGEIPEAWRVGKLGDVAFVTKGTTPTTIGGKFVDKGINFIKAESITEQHGFNLNKFSFIDEYTNNLLNRSVVQTEDILYTIAGTIGRFALVTKDLIPANTNQAVAVIRSNNEIVDPYYLKCYFDLSSTKESLVGSVVEAVQANLSLGSIKDCKILIPSNIGMQMFREKIKPLFLRQDLNNVEIQTLSKLRDDLLSKIFTN